jgi:hypothetical protein
MNTNQTTDAPSFTADYGLTEAEYDAVMADFNASENLTGAAKAARTRKEKKVCAATPYGKLLLSLSAAQKASDSAKATAANGLHIRDYYGCDESRYARANYRRSRAAREGRYSDKEDALGEAVKLAGHAGVVCGHKEGVLYFELATGQASFHSASHGAPDYAGEWDGFKGYTAARIDAGISFLLTGGVIADIAARYAAAQKFDELAHAKKVAEQEAKIQATTRFFVIASKGNGSWQISRELQVPSWTTYCSFTSEHGSFDGFLTGEFTACSPLHAKAHVFMTLEAATQRLLEWKETTAARGLAVEFAVVSARECLDQGAFFNPRLVLRDAELLAPCAVPA